MLEELQFYKAKKEDFCDFYFFFEKSIKKQFPYYSANSAAFILEKDYTKDFLKKELQERRKLLFLSKHEGKIVGFLLVAKVYVGLSLGNWIAVMPEFQGKGIASKLLHLWEEDAHSQGAHKLWLWTTEDRVSFYKNRGFIFMGSISEAWHGIDHYLFYKTLQKPKEENYLHNFLKGKKHE